MPVLSFQRELVVWRLSIFKLIIYSRSLNAYTSWAILTDWCHVTGRERVCGVLISQATTKRLKHPILTWQRLMFPSYGGPTQRKVTSQRDRYLTSHTPEPHGRTSTRGFIVKGPDVVTSIHCYNRHVWSYSVFFCPDFNRIWGFWTDFHRSTQVRNFTEIRRLGFALIRADRQTEGGNDGHDGCKAVQISV